MAATPTLISLEEYLRTSYHPDCDFVDGELEQRHLGEYPHSKLQAWMVRWFGNHEAEWSIDAVVEHRVQVTNTKFRVCDVVLLRGYVPQGKIAVTPPLVCIEVLSPEDRLSRAELVLADYWGMGVRNVWLIDPVYRAAYVYNEAGLQFVRGDDLTVLDSPAYLQLGDLFRVLD